MKPINTVRFENILHNDVTLARDRQEQMAMNEEQQSICSAVEESSDEDEYEYSSDVEEDCQYVKSYSCEPEYSK